MKQIDLPECGDRLSILTEKSIEFIHQHFPHSQGFWGVAFSGGKDSLVIYDLVKRSGLPYKCYYINPGGIDPPQLYRFIREEYPEVKWFRGKPFFKLMRKKGFPLRTVRWCCELCKHTQGMNCIVLVGVRGAESNSRKKRGAISFMTKKHITYSPIFNWTDKDVWRYIKDNGIKYCHLYDEGFDRLGCVICPMIAESKIPMHMEAFPKHWSIYKKIFFDIWEYRSIEGNSKLQPYFKEVPVELGWERFTSTKPLFNKKRYDTQLEMEYLMENEQ